jgi:hypothetical protein
MATKKASARKIKGTAALKPATVAALNDLEKQGRPVHVIGRLKNGKLEIDQASLEEATRRFPNASWAFVAMNAPFDPVTHA